MPRSVRRTAAAPVTAAGGGLGGAIAQSPVVTASLPGPQSPTVTGSLPGPQSPTVTRSLPGTIPAPAHSPAALAAAGGQSGNTTPMTSLMQDPAFAAFINSSGLGQDLALADAARRRQGINQALGINTEEIGATGEQQRHNIAGKNEANGIYRSGQNQTELANQESSQARQMGLAQLNAANQLGDIESGLATGDINRNYDITSKALDAAGNITEADAAAQAGQQAPTTGIGDYTPGAIPSYSPTLAPKPKAKPLSGGGGGKYKAAF